MDDSDDTVGRGPELASHYLRDGAHEYGDQIYAFIEEHDIGKSAYGRLMDTAANGKGVINHRLYGHHVIYDFPLQRPDQIPEFAEHLFSDAFTKTGLPLVPGQALEDTTLMEYCDRLSRSWDFVNGFDVLSATVSIYRGQSQLRDARKELDSIETFPEFAKSVGFPAVEFAIAMSTANPFLAVGSALNATATIKKLVTSSSVAYFHRVNRKYRLDIQLSGRKKSSIVGQSLSENLDDHSLSNTLDQHKL
jgi:hypothetical protein